MERMGWYTAAIRAGLSAVVRAAAHTYANFLFIATTAPARGPSVKGTDKRGKRLYSAIFRGRVDKFQCPLAQAFPVRMSGRRRFRPR